MENAYGIGVSNRYELFYCEDVDPVDLLQQAEKKSKEKVEKKKDKDFTKPPKSAGIRGHEEIVERKKKDVSQEKPRGKDKEPEAHLEERENRGAGDRGRRGRGFGGRGGGAPRENSGYGSRPFQENQDDRGNRRGGNRGEGGVRRGGGRYSNNQGPREGGYRKDDEFAPRYDNSNRYESSGNEAGGEFGGEGGYGRGRGGGFRGRGRGGGFRGDRRGEGRGGRREFDRHSGSGYQGLEKKNGAGSHNWGDSTADGQIADQAEFDEWNAEAKPNDSIVHDAPLADEHDDEPKKTEEGAEDDATKTDADGGENGKEDDAAKVMTLDEWKAAQKETRVKPNFNLRKAGEGEDPKQWKNLFILPKKEKFKSGDESEEEEDDDDNDELPANKKNAADLIQIVFSDPARRGGFGPRGRGTGFEGRPGRRGGRGGPRGRPDRGRGGGFGDRNDGGAHQRAPKVDDERDFPSL